MTKKTGYLLTAALFLGVVCLPAAAWGPRAQTTIVVAAAQLLSKENAIPLAKLLDHIRAGADISPTDFDSLFPDATKDPIRTIQDEMALLQNVREVTLDPYLAYRMGALGKLVARITAPMMTADPRYRTLYYADIENNIGNANLKSSPRREVDPPVYFVAVQREAAARSDVIEREYQAGIGFRGVAGQALGQDISRSVNAVADVWYTILQGRAQVVNISETRVREYFIGALEYYLARRNTAEVSAVYEKLVSLGAQTPEMRKRIADMFYDAEQYERAIQEYRAVLAEQPGRRDVVQRISEYYKRRGEQAMKSGRLDAAREAYRQAAEADRLDPDAQQLLLQTEKRIADREERQKAAQTALDQAFAAEKNAEDCLRRSDYTEAMNQLTQAEQLYASVSDEFPEERRAAQNGLNNVVKRKNQLKDEMLRNAQNFSGSGSSGDVLLLVKSRQSELARESIAELLETERNAAIKALAADRKSALSVASSPQ